MKSKFSPYKVEGFFKEKYIRLIDNQNNFNKSIHIAEAKKMAKQSGYDLVCFENGDSENIPLCKIIDFGQWKYREDKKKKNNNNSKSEIKEFRFSLNIDSHDIEHKIKHANEFLSSSHGLLFTMRLKGREKGKVDLAVCKLREICSLLEHKICVEEKINGTNLSFKIKLEK